MIIYPVRVTFICSQTRTWFFLYYISSIRPATGQAGYVVNSAVPFVGPAPDSLPFGRLTLNFVSEVSAMCTPDGITAQLMFSYPFNGKIYSYRYPSVHECVYFNTKDMNMILFSIPNYKCGTRVTKGSNNVIRTIDNEVYVQFDKEYQNAEDRRYLFVCDLENFGSGSSGFGGGTIPPIITPPPYIPSFGGASIFTVRPGSGVTVFTVSPTELIGIGESARPDVTMEIQDGIGPNRPLVQRTLQLGDPITLVVRARSNISSNNYNMLVHSCSANDGTDSNKIEFIDRQGCTTRDQIAGPMQRLKQGPDTIYYVPLKAFKFPASENVYFSCSVEICSSPSCTVPDICSRQFSELSQFPRQRRSMDLLHGGHHDMQTFSVSELVRIAEKKLEFANFAQIGNKRANMSSDPSSYVSGACINSWTVLFLLLVIVLLFITVITMAIQILRTKTGRTGCLPKHQRV